MAGPINSQLIATLLRQHGDALYRYAAQWTVFPDDCVQEAFVKLAGQKSLPDSTVAWLYRVVKNIAINQSKSEQRRTKYEQRAAEKLAFDQKERRNRDQGFNQASRNDDQALLCAALSELDIADRVLIVLRVWSELTWDEIAQLTNQSSSGAQRHYVAALKILKQKLEQLCPSNPSRQKILNPTNSDCRQT